MRRLAIGIGLVAGIAAACGESRTSSQAEATSGGETAGPSGGAVAASGAAGATGGLASATGGSPVSSGGRADNAGGEAPSPEGGATTGSGGAVVTGGSGGTPASGGGSNEGGGGASAGTPGDCSCGPLEQCFDGTLCVARSVQVPDGFAIDATEVTRSQYSAWLATGPARSRQSPQCEWNDDFEPDEACMAQPSVCQGADCGDHPQPCLDFCDAAAYCRAIDKQICGGLDGGPADRAGTDSLWLIACTSNGAHDYPYGGDSFVTGRCNDQTANSETTVTVASKPDCQSPEPDYAGIFDLVGNLREWEDNCNTAEGPTDVCRVRGGAFGISAAAPLCGENVPTPRGSLADTIGFRCCEPRAR